MRIQISEYGALSIERAGVMTAQYCPKSPNEGVCSHYCPLFGEPDWDNPGLCRGRDYLTICEGRILGGHIEDKRVVKRC